MPFFLALLALPVVEIALFILIGGWIGVLPTLALVLLAAFGGVALMRRAGQGAAERIRMSLAQEADPSIEIIRTAMTFMAGMLLILPGFLTDAFALALLIPALQRAVFATLRRRARTASFVLRGAGFSRGPGPTQPTDRVIDTDYTDVTPRQPSRWTDPDR